MLIQGEITGAPSRIRTRSLLIRSQMFPEFLGRTFFAEPAGALETKPNVYSVYFCYRHPDIPTLVSPLVLGVALLYADFMLTYAHWTFSK